MTIAKCTESGKNTPIFDLAVCSGIKKDIPPYISFSLPDGSWPEGYDGEGVLTVDLKDVLQEFLEIHLEWDGGENTPNVTALLREYADKLDATMNECALAS